MGTKALIQRDLGIWQLGEKRGFFGWLKGSGLLVVIAP